MKRTRMVEKGQRSLTFTAYAVTILFAFFSLIPVLWMVSSAFKSDKDIDAYPPKWIPQFPQSIRVTLDYSGLGPMERADYEKDAMEAIWFPWMKNIRENVGEVRITGIRDGKKIFQAYMASSSFRAGQPSIVPSTLFTDQLMDRKLPMIREKKLSKFTWYGDGGSDVSGGKGVEKSELSLRFADFYGASGIIQGKVATIEEKQAWTRLFDSFISVNKIAMNAAGPLGFTKYFINSAIVTLSSVAIQLLLGGLAGYTLAHLIANKKWQFFWIMFFLATIMIPDISLLLPLYLLMKDLHLVNSLWAIILPHSAWGIIIFLFKGFFDQISKELLQAARVDGASEFRTFLQIVAPLSVPIFAAVSVLTFIPVWNEFVWPLVVNNLPKYWTFTVALNDLQNQSNAQQNMIMASSFISMIPLLVIFVFAQKYIEKGVAFSGVKG